MIGNGLFVLFVSQMDWQTILVITSRSAAEIHAGQEQTMACRLMGLSNTDTLAPRTGAPVRSVMVNLSIQFSTS